MNERGALLARHRHRRHVHRLRLFDTPTGELIGLKVPVDPARFAAACATAFERLASEHGVDPARDRHRRARHHDRREHGDPADRRGLGLLVTDGFRDVLELQRLRLPNPFNFDGDPPAAADPARIAWPRCASGSAPTAASTRRSTKGAVREAARRLSGQGVEGLVVSLLHAYRNAGARAAGARGRRAGRPRRCPSAARHDVWPQTREYERTALAVLNAYVQPRCGAISRASSRRSPRAACRPRPTSRSRTAASCRWRRAAPADGGDAALRAGLGRDRRRLRRRPAPGCRNVITLDMGGTSADIAVVENGRPRSSTTSTSAASR